jgi:hypothetical protein
VFKRSARDIKRAYGERMVWKGCHIECAGPPTLDDVKRSLVKRIHNDLHLAIPLQPQMRGMVWDAHEEPNHLGMVFQVNIDSEDVVNSMMQKEFRKSGRQHTMSGTFQQPAELVTAIEELKLEPWSVSILQEIGKWS